MQCTDIRVVTAVSGLALGLFAANADAQLLLGKEREPVRSPVQRPLVQRAPIDPGLSLNPHELGMPPALIAASFPDDLRTIDGVGNNLANPEWGAAGVHLLRDVAADYADGVGAPSGADRPSARVVSNAVHDQGGASIPNPQGLSDYLWQWGQFLDHDITETPIPAPGDAFDILVPAGDPFFDNPETPESETIPLDRSEGELVGGVREQFNNITAFVDASNVYGSEHDRADELRTLDGTGRLKVSAGDLMPYNVNNFPNAMSNDASFFLGGDVRANEQAALAAMHTLFVREHNRLAGIIASEEPGLTGDEIYETARAIVAAEMQVITYKEWLPALLGEGRLPEYTGYDPDLDPGITNVFATAAFRVGHTMLSSEILRLNADGSVADEGNLDLAAAFFDPSQLADHGIDSIMLGLSAQLAQKIDNFVVGDVRNFLFGQPGNGGFDLASLNLQRGRDHGLAGYNDIREHFGLGRVSTFEEIGADQDVADRLRDAYGQTEGADNVDRVDAWTGMLAEAPLPGSTVGETLDAVIVDQFVRLRDGDRFWYETYLPPELVDLVESLTLGDIIRLNTGIRNEMGRDVFRAAAPCLVELADPRESQDFTDVTRFVEVFGNGDELADMNRDGAVNFGDVIKFIEAFNAGCGEPFVGRVSRYAAPPRPARGRH